MKVCVSIAFYTASTLRLVNYKAGVFCFEAYAKKNNFKWVILFRVKEVFILQSNDFPN